jgi:hypothetical protein
MVSERQVVASGILSIFLAGNRVRVGEVELLEPQNQAEHSPDLYGRIRLFDGFFKVVKPNSHVYLAVWSSGSNSDLSASDVNEAEITVAGS